MLTTYFYIFAQVCSFLTETDRKNLKRVSITAHQWLLKLHPLKYITDYYEALHSYPHSDLCCHPRCWICERPLHTANSSYNSFHSCQLTTRPFIVSDPWTCGPCIIPARRKSIKNSAKSIAFIDKTKYNNPCASTLKKAAKAAKRLVNTHRPNADQERYLRRALKMIVT